MKLKKQTKETQDDVLYTIFIDEHAKTKRFILVNEGACDAETELILCKMFNYHKEHFSSYFSPSLKLVFAGINKDFKNTRDTYNYNKYKNYKILSDLDFRGICDDEIKKIVEPRKMRLQKLLKFVVGE